MGDRRRLAVESADQIVNLLDRESHTITLEHYRTLNLQRPLTSVAWESFRTSHNVTHDDYTGRTVDE